MTISDLIKYSICLLLALSFISCGRLIKDHRYDYLKEEQGEELKIPKEEVTRPIIDFYPVSSNEAQEVSSEFYEIPLPQQVFSCGRYYLLKFQRLERLRSNPAMS